MADFRLQVFYTAAKNLSFTKAAQELYISQPAVTRHINALEEQYQVLLFERQGNKLELTPAGKLMMDHSERILQQYQQLEYAMHLFHQDHVPNLLQTFLTLLSPCSMATPALLSMSLAATIST